MLLEYHCLTFTSRARYAAACRILFRLNSESLRLTTRGRGAVPGTWYIEYWVKQNSRGR
jgi:hypothetical protein